MWVFKGFDGKLDGNCQQVIGYVFLKVWGDQCLKLLCILSVCRGYEFE